MATDPTAVIIPSGHEKALVDSHESHLPPSQSTNASNEKIPRVDQSPSADAIAQPSAIVQDSDHLSGLPLFILIAGLCLATFFIALDNTILGES